MHNAVFIWHRPTKANWEVNTFFTNLCTYHVCMVKRRFCKTSKQTKKNHNNNNIRKASPLCMGLHRHCHFLLATIRAQIALDPAAIPSQREFLIIWCLSLTLVENRGAFGKASKAKGNLFFSPSRPLYPDSGCVMGEEGNFNLLVL